MSVFFRVLWFSFMSFLGIWASLKSEAQVLSATAREVTVQYRARFVLNHELKTDRTAVTWVEFHASHAFAYLKSSVWSRQFNTEMLGVGAPKVPAQIKVISTQTVTGARGGKHTEITYEYTGQWLVLNSLAISWMRQGAVSIPMPYQLQSIYDPHCTDEHYQSLGDYWYFYDPYKKGCEYLLESPYHKSVTVKISPTGNNKREYRPRLEQLRGNNGNGPIIRIDVIHGFSDGPRTKRDEGRTIFNRFGRELVRKGYRSQLVGKNAVYSLYEFTKGNIVIRSSLVDSDAEVRSNRFAAFFKEAIENADVVAYLGHSGLGGNLDIPSLESRVGSFQFDPGKVQIFYFDSCSSYSYYLSPFLQSKSRSSVDVITNGLESYFYTEIPKLMALIDAVVDARVTPTWLEILGKMEQSAEAPSSLISVGGI